MQFTKAYKEAIARGELTTSFRTWEAPQAKVGGQYNIPPFGAIEVEKIQRLAAAQVSRAALRRAGFSNLQALYDFLEVVPDTQIYQVDFHYLGDQPVKQVDRTALPDGELADIVKRLQRMDKNGAWTRQALTLINAHPGVGARMLAPQVCAGGGMELAVFKRNVRKLKALGLTISLETGYTLSPRGEQLIKHPLFAAVATD